MTCVTNMNPVYGLAFHDSPHSTVQHLPSGWEVKFLQVLLWKQDFSLPNTCDVHTSGTAEGEGLVGPRPHHFFALKRKIIKIKKKT